MKPITAQTKIVGLIGWPVGHSVSPLMHNAAFAALDLDWRYIPLPVSPEPDSRIGEAVRGLRSLGFRGANVTVPHKQAVIPFMNDLTQTAEAIGAVNTIIVQEDGSLLGDNTDARGFIADLKDHGINPKNERILVLGAGGSARAVVFGLAEAGASSITVVNRTAARADELVQAMIDHFPLCLWGIHPSLDSSLASDAYLIVNCTSIGMVPNVDAMPWTADIAIGANQNVYDLVYNPPQTRLVTYATNCGALAVSGKGMLVWQGAIAFELWTGIPAPLNVMKRAIGI